MERKDISDNTRDEKRMQPEEVNMELPEVKDIPGQENVEPPPLGELADTTASSDDEEGKGVLDEVNDADVTDEERELLDQSASADPAYRDEKNFQRAALDNRDADGEALNEEDTVDDLDVPGSELDDESEETGAEDEENNAYSDSDTD
jgi:hypothetical protein